MEFRTTRDHELAGALRCAVFHCAWFDYDSNWTTSIPGEQFTARCERCGRERRDVLDAGRNVISRRYYPSRPVWTYARGQRPSLPEFRGMLIAQRMAEARRARRIASKQRRAS